jgi:hypothetical protein
MKEIGHRVGERLDERNGAGDRRAAGEHVGDAEGNAEMNDSECGGLGQAQGEWDAHAGLRIRVERGGAAKVRAGPARVHLIVPIAAIGNR